MHRTWLIALVLAAATLGGCALFRAASDGAREEQAAAEEDASPNHAMALNGHVIALSLHAYAREHQGRRPAPAALVAALSQDDYLPGNRLPRSPWGPAREPIRIVASEASDADLRLAEQDPGLTAAAFFARHPLGAAPGAVVVLVCPDRLHAAVFGVGDAAPGPALVYGPAPMVTPALRPYVARLRARAKASGIL